VSSRNFLDTNVSFEQLHFLITSTTFVSLSGVTSRRFCVFFTLKGIPHLGHFFSAGSYFSVGGLHEHEGTRFFLNIETQNESLDRPLWSTDTYFLELSLKFIGCCGRKDRVS